MEVHTVTLATITGAGQRGRAFGRRTASEEFSPVDAPSTTVYTPFPGAYSWETRSGFIFDKPDVFLDSRYDPGGTPLTWGTDLTLTDFGNVASNTTDLQSKIDAWAAGSANVRLKLPSGYVASQIRLKNNTNGNYWLYIEWTGINAVQAEGVHANRNTVATTHANASIIQNDTGLDEPAVRCNLSAHHVRLVGIHFRSTATSGAGASTSNLVQLAGSVGSDDFSVQDTAAKAPQWIIIDRCWVDGQDIGKTRNGVQLDARNSCIVDSVINGIWQEGFENHGIVCFNGPGPFKIVGNAVEAGSINIFVGGVDPLISGLQTEDVEIRRNYLYKRPEWNQNDKPPEYPNGPFPETGGPSRVTKNLLELKWGNRILVEGNVFDGNYYGGGQYGSFLVWKTENSNGDNTTVQTLNVTYRHNLAKNVSGGYEFIGIGVSEGPVAAPLSRVHHYNNLVYELAADRLTEINNSSKAIHLSTGANQIQVDHDTVVISQTESTSRFAKPITFQGDADHGFKINNCVLVIPIASPPNASDARTIFGDGSRTVSPDTGTNTFDVFAPSPGVGGWEFTDNVVVRTYSAQVNPPLSQYVETVSEVGFTNVVAGNFRLNDAPGSESAFLGLCADGSNPGADIDLIQLATAGVAS